MGEYFPIPILSLLLELNSCWSSWNMYICHIFFDLLVSVDKTYCYHYWIFRNSILRPRRENFFAPHSVSVDMRGYTERAFENLWRFLLFLSLIWLYYQCDSYFFFFFANNLLSYFCNSTAFSFSVVFTWYCESGILVCEFIIHSKTFSLLRCIMELLLYPKSNTICSAYKSNLFT